MTPSPTLHWPPQPEAEARLGLLALTHRVDIDVEPDAVWRYACNAVHWAEWHPATRKVDPLPDRPQSPGETIVEHVADGTAAERVAWRVLAAEPGRLWVAAADTPRHLMRITIRLHRLGTAATRFERTLDIRTRSPLTHWLDRWTLPRMLVPRARDALAALKLRLEAANAPPEVVPPAVPRWRAEGSPHR